MKEKIIRWFSYNVYALTAIFAMFGVSVLISFVIFPVFVRLNWSEAYAINVNYWGMLWKGGLFCVVTLIVHRLIVIKLQQLDLLSAKQKAGNRFFAVATLPFVIFILTYCYLVVASLNIQENMSYLSTYGQFVGRWQAADKPEHFPCAEGAEQLHTLWTSTGLFPTLFAKDAIKQMYIHGCMNDQMLFDAMHKNEERTNQFHDRVGELLFADKKIKAHAQFTEAEWCFLRKAKNGNLDPSAFVDTEVACSRELHASDKATLEHPKM